MKMKKLSVLLLLFCFVFVAVPVVAQEKSTDEVARELANPNNSLASLTFKNQFHWYEGDLHNADPLKDITILTKPREKFHLIMKDGKIYKNTIQLSGLTKKV